MFNKRSQVCFPPSVWHLADDKDHVRFCRNCASCTQSHRQCRFAGPHLSKCSRCIEYHVPCFFTLLGEFYSYYYYYFSPFYDSSFIACAILFLLGQGCHNDIKKPSCLLSCDQYSPSTGLAGVSCGTKDNCQVNCKLFVA